MSMCMIRQTSMQAGDICDNINLDKLQNNGFVIYFINIFQMFNWYEATRI